MQSLVVGLVGLCCLARALDAQIVSISAPPTVLSAGDVVRITVWRRSELSGEFPIAADGSILHPLYRELNVVGVPFQAVEDRVRAFLARLETNPSFVVAPLLRIAVGGEVRQPSLYTLPPETTLAQAVAMAGGATERGRLDQVRITRGGRVYTVDLTRPDTEITRARIASGDQILVGRRSLGFRDVVGPTSSVIAAIAAIVSLALR
jgi:polysaccharide export outer membrane protein